MRQLEISDLLHNPQLYLFGFEGGDALFLRMDRHCYAESIFFDGRIVSVDAQLIPVPLTELHAAAAITEAPPARLGWIFHMAHTGSTLLARALDRPGKCLAIREPMTLRALGVEAGAARSGAATTGPWRERLDLAVRMLGRRFADDEAVVVKANVPVNALLPELLAKSAEPKAILLHFGLEDYLTAILRSPNHRKWVEHIFTEMRLGALPEVGPAATLQTAEKAAALWLFQMRAFADAIAANSGIRSLDANRLFDEPVPCLKAAGDYLGTPMGDAEAQAIVAGPLFATYSKNPNAPFDNRHRQARVAETRATLADELRIARAWVAPRTAALPLPERLAQPLCGENSKLW